jgi:hypothetical protein
MPYKLRKTKNKNCYTVYNAVTKRKFAKCATRENAVKQLKLLRALQFNKNFVPINQTLKKGRRTKKVIKNT